MLKECILSSLAFFCCLADQNIWGSSSRTPRIDIMIEMDAERLMELDVYPVFLSPVAGILQIETPQAHVNFASLVIQSFPLICQVNRTEVALSLIP